MGSESERTHDRILVATDNSEPAKRATEEALAFAAAFDANLFAIYVLETGAKPQWYDDPDAEPGTETRAGRALDSVRSMAEDRGLAGAIETAVVEGKTSAAILEYADKEEIDLVVLGTHGREGLDRLVVGSVAENVVRRSPVPVVTVATNGD